MEALPDDVLVEIFLRVADAVALFRCAATCKRWRGLAANWPDGARHPSSLIGFFEEQQTRLLIHPPSVQSPVLPPFIPAPQSPLGPRRRFLVVSVPETGSPMDRAAPLASRRGLVLVRLGAQALRSMDPTVHLAVCNPLAGTSQLLPPLEPSRSFSFSYEPCCCAILSGADYCPERSTFFKVLVVNIDWRGQNIYLRTLSSAQPSWTAPTRHDNPVGWRQQRQCGAVVCRGTAHWLFRDALLDLHILNVDAQTGHVSSAKILLPAHHLGFQLCDEPRLGATSDGGVTLNFLHRACLWVEVWIRQGTTNNWLQACVIELQQPETKRYISDAQFMCVGERSRTLLVKDSRGNMYVAYLETGTMEEVKARLCDPVSTAIPLEIDWPGFFPSRLAGRNKGIETGEAVLRLASSFVLIRS